MNKMLGWIAVLGGGYLVLKYLGVDPLTMVQGATTVGAGTPVGTGTTTSTSPQANTVTSAASTSLIVAMQNYCMANSINMNQYLSVDQWNALVFVPVKKVAGPAPEDIFPGIDRNATYNFMSYAAALSKAGLSGLGMIASRINPYHNPIAGRPFGSYLNTMGLEAFTIRRD